MKDTRVVLILFVFLLCTICWAETYKWVDEKGTTHFTDDPTTIPQKYLDRIRELQERRDAEIVQKYREQKEREQAELEKTRKEREREESSGPEPIYQGPDMMDEMTRRFPGISYQWTQDMSLWIKVPAEFTHYKNSLAEIAIKVANYYHRQKGHMVCVRFFYADGITIVRECR